MAVLGTVVSLVLYSALPGRGLLTLAPAVLKAVVDVAWLVVAARPGVRAALR